MQRRIDMLPALAQVAKKYSIHEYKTIKDTMKLEVDGQKICPLNQKVDMENNFLKIQAVFEKYQKLELISYINQLWVLEI